MPNTVVTIIIAILVFSFLIFFHELGHFLTAKWAGIRVNEFSIGMGPALFSFGKKETKYSIRLLPIGGYVSMEGEDEDSQDDRAFNKAPVLKRILVVAAGALMNILLGLIIMIVLTSQQSLIGTTTIAAFEEGAVSNQSLQINDEILKINGMRTRIDNDVLFGLLRDQDGVMDITVRRDGEVIELKDVRFEMPEAEDGSSQIFLDFKVYGEEKTFFNTIGYAFNWTGSVVKMVVYSFLDLVTGQFQLNQLAGPVGVTAAIGESAAAGGSSLLLMVGFITINLGIMNILPLPALDGGRLVFLLIELVRRKPVPAKYEGYVHFAGFVLLMLLMVVVTFGDITRLFGGG